MYEIEFYEDRNGRSEIVNFIRELNDKSATGKESRINFNKVVAYLDILQELGTRVGEPVTKHLDGEIWELRPLRNRLLYHIIRKTNLSYFIILSKRHRKRPNGK